MTIFLFGFALASKYSGLYNSKHFDQLQLKIILLQTKRVLWLDTFLKSFGVVSNK